ncbi:MAG: response regulator, partial [Candidatus Eisenbacteria bacterium]|nr:response regulator [Candidatus Eisenbacteria bacterium]
TFSFVIRAPLAADTPEVEIDPPSGVEVPGRKDGVASTILLVEDAAINRKVLSRMLESAGLRVELAADGLEAIEAWTRVGPDLILMDMQMPEFDGLQATRAIRTLEERFGGHVPIVALTASAMESDRRKCLEAGMDDYLSKPIRSEDLIAKIGQMLPSDPAEPSSTAAA